MATREVTRVQHKTLEERVYEELVRLIVDAALEPGTQIDEQDLAARLGVSRTPLRAALARLVQEGLVVTVPYRGTFIRQFTAREIDELYELRTNLEQLALRWAAQRIDAKQLAALDEAVAECEVARAQGDLAALNAADAEFHRLIARAADNRLLLDMLDSLRLRVRGLRSIAIANAPPRDWGASPSNRRRIVDALRRRDGEAAAQLIDEHLQPVRQSVLAHLVNANHPDTAKGNGRSARYRPPRRYPL
ncbi:MAG: GntR family transcriptional regulator [Chloroflexi bacterium]|nr:GntR family transcriptional regulator [Chloroflexota bacterium]